MTQLFQKKYKKYKPFLFPAILVGLTVTIVLFGIIPAFKQSQQLFEQGSILQTEVAALQEKVTLLDSLNEADLESKLQIATKAIPVDQSLATIVQTVETVGTSVGASLSTIRLDSKENISTAAAKIKTQQEKQLGANLLPFTMNAQLTFDQMKEFLMKTTNVRRFIRAKSFNLASKNEDNLSTSVSFDAFYLPLQNKDAESPLIPVTQQEEQLISKIAGFEDAGQLIILPDEPGLQPDAARNPFTF